MGSFDWAEAFELVGLFILNSLANKYGKDCVGRDDGLSKTLPRRWFKEQKQLHPKNQRQLQL